MGPGSSTLLLFFPANLDLVDILGDMNFDFENFVFWSPDFQVPRFPEIWLGPRVQLGPI